MGDYSQKSIDNFYSGCNCAQAILCAFSDKIGFDEDTSMKLASSFGGGMARLREVCGAVSAMFMVAGLLKGYSKRGDELGKMRHYQLIQRLSETFKKQHGTIICRELLGEEGEDTSPIPSQRTDEYYRRRPCEKFIKTAAEILESEILD